MNQETKNQKMSQILAKCWSDAAFKASLLADPVAVLKAQGVEVPAGVQVRVVEDTDQVVHWVLPAKPGALSDADLEGVAGGGMLGSIYSHLPPSVRPVQIGFRDIFNAPRVVPGS